MTEAILKNIAESQEIFDRVLSRIEKRNVQVEITTETGAKYKATMKEE